VRPGEQARLDAGLCIKGCGRPKKPTAQRCERCTKRAAQVVWCHRLTAERKPRGPAKRQRALNLDTDALIEAHVSYAKGYAMKVAARFRLPDASDVIGDAMYGLVVAGRTFDASYGVDFGAWATRQIKGEVFGGLRKQWQAARWQVPMEQSV
jgi:hypothetical protein